MPVLLVFAVLVTTAGGAFVQGVSGLGFSLIAAPSLALAVGPREGVALVNLLAMVVATAVFVTRARHLNVARSAVLVPAGLAGVVPGTIVFRLLPASSLQIAVGAVTGLGLAAVCVSRLSATPRVPVTAAAGLASGFTAAVGGAGGPALTVYAIATGWSQAQFAATVQISYAVQGAAALALKGGIPHLSFPLLCGAIAAALVGLACAHLLAHRINAARARRAAIAIATLATMATVISGIISWATVHGGIR